MSDLEHAREILAMARKDLSALAAMTDQAVFAEEIFGFHAQQAVEKALKAWIAARGFEYPHTHDLSVLLEMIDGHERVVPNLWDLVGLAAFAVQFRYSIYDELAQALDRTALREAIQRLVEHVDGVVSSRPSGNPAPE